MNINKHTGFTLIELIVVIVLLGVLSVVAVPRFIDISRDAKIAVLGGIASSIESTTDLVKAKARVKGLRPVNENPDRNRQGGQAEYIIDFGFGAVEVDWRNLCPESRGEEVSRLTMLDFLDLSDNLESRVTNQFTFIGYDVPSNGASTTQGCYVLYNSFGNPDCTVEVVTADC